MCPGTHYYLGNNGKWGCFKTKLIEERWLKLHIVKTFVNLAVRVLLKVIPSKSDLTASGEAYFPQMQMLERVYKKLYKAYALDCYCGYYDDIPRQTVKGVRDRNFLNLLQLSERLFLFVGDIDRYYRMWLVLTFFLIHDELDQAITDLSLEEFQRWNLAQWCLSYPSVSRGYFNRNKREFLELSWANNALWLVRFDVKSHAQTLGLADEANLKKGVE